MGSLTRAHAQFVDPPKPHRRPTPPLDSLPRLSGQAALRAAMLGGGG